MKISYIILMMFLISILLFGCNTQTNEEKQEICSKDCLDDGWQYGEWVGYNFCNCYNKTIVNIKPEV